MSQNQNINRQLRAAQRKFEQQQRKAVADYNRRAAARNRKVEHQNKKAVDDYNRRAAAHNRKVEQQNKKAVDDYNRQVDQVNEHNRRANAQNATVIADLNRQLRSPSESGPQYSPSERVLADRISEAVSSRSDRKYDVFLSYARIDGSEVGAALRDALHDLDVTVWFDEVAIRPGKSQSLQMDRGLRDARCGIALLTPAYLAGRFWTERELGALLHKEMLIPVLHGVSFDEVAEYSGILPDLAGFETSRDEPPVIAQKVAAAVLYDPDEEPEPSA